MKKNDKNILIITIFAIIFLLIWTLSRYSISKKDSSKLEQINIQEQQKEIEDFVEKEQAQNVIPTISAMELNTKNLVANDIAIVDTRTMEQFHKGHIKGSFHVDDLDIAYSNRTIVFVTETGNEDLLMSHYRDLSSTNTVYNLLGGLNAWTKTGLNVISLELPQNFENTSKVQFIEPRDLDVLTSDAQQKENIIILDTRREGNYQKEHIPDSMNIPLSELEYRYREIPIMKEIYVYGTDDEASFRSGVLLYDLNFIGTKTVNGGFNAWKEYDYPVVQ